MNSTMDSTMISKELVDKLKAINTFHEEIIHSPDHDYPLGISTLCVTYLVTRGDVVSWREVKYTEGAMIKKTSPKMYNSFRNRILKRVYETIASGEIEINGDTWKVIAVSSTQLNFFSITMLFGRPGE